MIKVNKHLPVLPVILMACGSASVVPKAGPVVQPGCDNTIPGTVCFEYHEAPGRQPSESIIPTSLQTKNRNPIRHEKIQE
jgi:hypothetical protein